ncbi:MAG: proprotein convertase P-domain-containing protein [PVC group bacterium]
MKALRRISIPIAGFIILCACLSHPALATEYPGSSVVWTNFGTYTTGLNVPATGTVANVSLFVRSAQTQLGFDNNAMLLTSPLGTTIYLFDLSTYKITGTSLYLTRFIDTASVIITEGVPPYAGSFRPGMSFSNFNGEWMTGTWTLAVYNNRPGTGNTGAVTDWSLIINQATPVPTPSPVNPTPSPVPITYREYPGTLFSWIGISTTLSYISIGNQGVITDVNVNMNVDCTSSLDPLGMYLVSPEGTIVALFEKYDLSEHSLYLTTFDDAADQSILGGIAPYIGLYRPVESLVLFNNETMTGDWTLVAYNDDAGNNGTVSAWSLVIGIRDYLATPSPVPTKSPAPTPPQACYPVIPPGPAALYTGVQITQMFAPIEDDFMVYDVDVEVSAWCQGGCDSGCDLDTKALYLTSPQGTIVKLFGKHDLLEKGLYLTYFDDGAPISILDDIAPYYGPHQPVGFLGDFNGEWSAGTWTLSWYNDEAKDYGEVTHFLLCLNKPLPTPSPPCPTRTPTPIPIPTATPPEGYCPATFGDAFTAPGQEVTWGSIYVADPGLVKKITVRIDRFDITEEGDLDFVGMWLVSPAETVVELFPKHQLEEHSLSATWFDDTAPRGIAEGLGPYIGRWRPTGHLSDFYGQTIKGTWYLVVFNDFVCVQKPDLPPCEDWSRMKKYWQLEICPLPTLTPTPPPTAPIPTRTPTPVGYKTPIPTPPTPTPPPRSARSIMGDLLPGVMMVHL